jgi:tetratricopeptide (TPR) repeat protein
VTLAEQNQHSAALRDFNRVIELNPGLAIAYRNRAELLATLERMNEAVADYSRAIELLPDDAELYAARGYAWQRLGEFDRASADLDRALEISPDQVDLLTQRGNLEAEWGEYERAVADFRQAIANEPDRAEAYRSLAWLHATCPDARSRDAEQALWAARKAADLSAPGDYLVQEALAAAHAAAGEFDEARRIQQRAIADTPPEFAAPLRQRLALYEARQPYRSDPPSSRPSPALRSR